MAEQVFIGIHRLYYATVATATAIDCAGESIKAVTQWYDRHHDCVGAECAFCAAPWNHAGIGASKIVTGWANGETVLYEVLRLLVKRERENGAPAPKEESDVEEKTERG